MTAPWNKVAVIGALGLKETGTRGQATVLETRGIPQDQGEVLVFIAEGNALMRRAIKSWLTNTGMRIQVASSVAELLTCCDPTGRGCVVLGSTATGDRERDVRAMSGVRGLGMPILQIVEQGDVAHAIQALRQGAAEVLEMPLSEQTLVDGIQRALLGLDQFRRRDGRNLEAALLLSRLSKREQEVLRHVVAGRTNKEIARKLGVSRRTADFHRANILRKMQTESVAELINMVVTYHNDAMRGSPPFPQNITFSNIAGASARAACTAGRAPSEACMNAAGVKTSVRSLSGDGSHL